VDFVDLVVQALFKLRILWELCGKSIQFDVFEKNKFQVLMNLD